MRRQRIMVTSLGLLVLAVAATASNLADAFTSGLLAIIAAVAAALAAVTAPIVFWARNSIATLTPSSTQQEGSARRIGICIHSALRASFRIRTDQPVRILSAAEWKTGLPATLSGLDRGEATTLSAFVASMATMPRCTVIVGNPGAGKTSVLLDLAHRLLTEYVDNRTKQVPLPLSVGRWQPSNRSLSRWVCAEVAGEYGVARAVTSYWLGRGHAILLIDGIDLLAHDSRDAFVSSLNQWVRSAAGTQVVLTCRPPTYSAIADSLQVDQVATLLPLAAASVRVYLDELMSGSGPAGWANALRKLLSGTTLHEHLRLPAFLDVLSRSVAATVESMPEGDVGKREDPAAMAFQLGNRFTTEGDLAAARDAFYAATRVRGSRWRAPAAVGLSVVLERLGQTEAARRALLESVSLRLEDSLAPRLAAAEAELTDDERQVLRAMAPHVTYNEAQVTGAARLTPSRAASALRLLRAKGIVEPIDDTSGSPRFTRLLLPI